MGFERGLGPNRVREARAMSEWGSSAVCPLRDSSKKTDFAKAHAGDLVREAEEGVDVLTIWGSGWGSDIGGFLCSLNIFSASVTVTREPLRRNCWSGSPIAIYSAGTGSNFLLSMRVPNPSPALDKNRLNPLVQNFIQHFPRRPPELIQHVLIVLLF